MTEQKRTDSPSETLSQAANALFAEGWRAFRGGYVLTVDGAGFIDLMDPETGERTPLWGAPTMVRIESSSIAPLAPPIPESGEKTIWKTTDKTTESTGQ